MKKKPVHIRLKEECDLKKQIIAVLVAFTLVLATSMTAKNDKACINTCVQTYEIIRTAAEFTDGPQVSCAPINHILQEYISTGEEIYELENPADYMDGLTAISKRSIYVGEAEYCRLAVKLNI